MNSGYQPLSKEDEELFQQYSQGIEKAVREVFPSIPADFQLKPATILTEIGCGIFYDFKIGLPDGQFAEVSFHAGEKEPEQKFNVDPTPSSSATE